MTRHAKTFVVFVAIAVLGAAGYLGVLFGPVLRTGFRGMHVREQLLCRTDHKALLAACQELSARVADGKLETNVYMFGFWPDAEVRQFPQAIRALRPAFVTLGSDGTVRIEMNDKWWSLGVRAYPQGYEKRFPTYRFGDHKLLDDLWYYDDNYLHDPNYAREIEAILKEHGRLPVPAAAPDPTSTNQ